MNALYVAWRSAELHGGWRPVGRLEYVGGRYRFFYTEGARKPGFPPFPLMEHLEKVYESKELFPVFANRLLSKSRPEYESFLHWGGFDATEPPEPLMILSVTEGIRQTDALEVFPCPQPNEGGCYVNKFFIHGLRWVAETSLDRISKLKKDEQLKLMLDVQNEYDPSAVAVRTATESALIGYFPRYLANDISQLLIHCDVELMQLRIDRVNNNAPLQNRILCRLEACWPEEFTPCSGPDFKPIPIGVESQCFNSL